MEILVLVILILINGVFALAEIAFVSAKREEIEQHATQGNRHAVSVLSMMDEPERFLSSIQVGITLIGVVSGVYGGIAIADDLFQLLKEVAFLEVYAYQISLVLVVMTVTYFSILFGELVPKTIALRNPTKTILVFIPFIKGFAYFAHPAISFLSISTRWVLKLLGMKSPVLDRETDPVKEILGIVKMATIRNKIDREQEKILINTMNVKKIQIKDIMVRKEEVKVLTTNMSLTEALIEAHIHHHTRFPLLNHENPTEVLGYINFKDIVNTLRISPSLPTLRGIRRPISSFQEKDRVIDVLRNLIRTHQHIAIVKEPTGAFSGLVTLENILETIVGDIKDEYDLLPEFLYNITDMRLLAGGGIPVSKVRESVSERLPDISKPLGQWLMEFSKVPLKVESKITFADVVFIVRKISRSKVYEVIIERASVAQNGRRDT